MAAEQIAPGRPETLTETEEEKLRQLWAQLLQICGVSDDELPVGTSDVASPIANGQNPDSSQKADTKSKKRRLGLFNRKGSGKGVDPKAKTPAAEDVAVEPVALREDDPDDKYGQTKQFYEALANNTPEMLRETIWNMVKHDHPDALMLRFLRARKWDVNKALIMLISTMNWRATDMHVEDIMREGESGMVEAELNAEDPNEKRLARDFLTQLRQGKSFLHGMDRSGRPVCVVRVRLHRTGEQMEESVERHTVYLIETARLVVRPPVDTATMVFDMTGFSMANMDYAPVKFMIKCFEANYPESLGTVLVYKSPWVFQGIWKIIRGWLDPVVAAKVHFVNSVNELSEFIHEDRIIKELDGKEDWEYRYIEPVPGENERMTDEAARVALLARREKLVGDFEAATVRWIGSARDAAINKSIKDERESLASMLREGYWELDPYIRARSVYDRLGVLQPGGNINYYPGSPKADQPADGGAQTSADDVD